MCKYRNITRCCIHMYNASIFIEPFKLSVQICLTSGMAKAHKFILSSPQFPPSSQRMMGREQLISARICVWFFYVPCGSFIKWSALWFDTPPHPRLCEDWAWRASTQLCHCQLFQLFRMLRCCPCTLSPGQRYFKRCRLTDDRLDFPIPNSSFRIADKRWTWWFLSTVGLLQRLLRSWSLIPLGPLFSLPQFCSD